MNVHSSPTYQRSRDSQGSAKGLVRRLALIAVLAVSAVALIPTASFAANCLDCEYEGGGGSGGTTTSGSKYQYEITELAGRKETGLYINQGQTVRIVADPQRQIWSGLWFYGWNGPAGFGTANNQSPLPGAKAFSLLARIGDKYRYVGNGATLTAPASGMLTLFINDDKPGNGEGSFGVESVQIGSF